MFGFDQFAVKVGDKLVARKYGGWSLLNIRTAKPDMTELAPRMFEAETEYFKKTPKKYQTYESIEAFAKAPGDTLFLQTPETLYRVMEGGELLALDNAWIAGLETRKEAA